MSLVEQKLSRIDLNLLIALSVLLKEQNVSRAAELLFLSQSAMSRTLQRLREVFDDQLFIRASKGITPTVKALEIAKVLPDIIDSLNNLVTSKKFVPEQCTQTFAISLPTLLTQSVILPLIKDLQIKAPKTKLNDHTAKVNPFPLLESGALDFSINLNSIDDAHFISTPFTQLKLVIYGRKGHPLLEPTEVQLADCLEYDFAAFILDNDDNIQFKSPVDNIISSDEIKRNVVLRTSQLFVLLEFLKSSDALFIGPDVLMKSAELKEVLEPIYEFEQTPENLIDLHLIEHKRVAASPAHQWFKQRLMATMTL